MLLLVWFYIMKFLPISLPFASPSVFSLRPFPSSFLPSSFSLLLLFFSLPPRSSTETATLKPPINLSYSWQFVCGIRISGSFPCFPPTTSSAMKPKSPTI